MSFSREAFFCGKMLLLVLTTGMAKLVSPLQGKEKPLVRDKSPGYKRVSWEGWAVQAIPSCWDVTPHSGSEMGSRVGNLEFPTTLLKRELWLLIKCIYPKFYIQSGFERGTILMAAAQKSCLSAQIMGAPAGCRGSCWIWK